ncbi:flavodoxin-dependent (E)-4-hydroxy-3-methylbut-2-enyl-diphosphate synthase [bacterium]|nr:flavodoxin-dependent (E)-4-hydroxy-3-methylbut-2-enyl-diphosphate synthase [bacterium]RQV93322.1 MAG: flavodoxin-dependent (E)-4-hydroxy-3-methylbut-2-enyl-diphosphate synthase [bacterium]
MKRHKTKTIKVGKILIGGNAPITVQSMTNTKTEDVKGTVDQIRKLEDAGCEIVRIAVPSLEAAKVIPKIKKAISIPLVADIHFNYQLAIKAVEAGANKIRINPGNIGSKDKVKQILRAAKAKGIPVRIGVNAGSLEKKLIQKYDGITTEGLVESAINHIHLFEDFGFNNIVLSVKASNVPLTIEANRILSSRTDYPLHLGITESGTPHFGILRSAVGIGALLAEGIGDTIRVSLTGDPIQEVRAGYEILKSLNLRRLGPTIISCPTCGRTHMDIVSVVEKIEEALPKMGKPITVAIMGCEVNGPGEAKEADIGIACGKKTALLFKKGKVIRKIKEEEVISSLLSEIKKWG